MASGSEVSLIVEAGMLLAGEGVNVRLVSFPSWELFARQGVEYQNSVLLPGTKRIAVEAGVSMGWGRWTGDAGAFIGVDRFGASAPYKVIFEKFGLTTHNIVEKSHALLRRD